MSELLHVHLLTLLLLLCVLRHLVLNQLLQLLYPNLVQLQLLLLLLQYQQLLLLLQPPLLQLILNVHNFVIPTLLRLLPFLLEIVNLGLNFSDHLDGDYVGGLNFLPLFLAFFYFHFHLFYSTLLRDVLFMVLPQNSFIFNQFFR